MSKFSLFNLGKQLQSMLISPPSPNSYSHLSLSSSSTPGAGSGKGGKGKRPYKLQSPTGIIPIAPKVSHKSKSKKIKAIKETQKPSNENENYTTSITEKETKTKKKKQRIFANVDEYGLPALNPKDCQRRVEFSSKMLQMFEKDPEFLESVIFSDEGNFNLSLKSNSNEKRSKSRKPGRAHGESKPLPQIVWCGMTNKYIIGPYFFNSYVTERTYMKMLRTFLIPQLQSLGGPEKWWFQQDGNPPHRTRPVIKYLQDHFGSRVISHGCPLPWPPKSQDLTPLDYFLWDYLKGKLESDHSVHELSTKEEFRKGLIHQIDDLEEEKLTKVINQFPLRLEKCIDANGHRFDFDDQ